MTFKGLVYNNRSYFYCMVLYLALGTLVLLLVPKGVFEMRLNAIHSPFLDQFFYYVTWLGDGIFASLLAAAVFIFFNIYRGLQLGLVVVATAIPIQLLKRAVFSDMPRPAVYLQDHPAYGQLHWVKDLEIHHWHSFPSGHTAQAFALFLALSFWAQNKTFTYVFFALAVCTGLSRIYLLQHFFMDTFAGAAIASIVSIIVYYSMEKSRLSSIKRLRTGLWAIRTN